VSPPLRDEREKGSTYPGMARTQSGSRQASTRSGGRTAAGASAEGTQNTGPSRGAEASVKENASSADSNDSGNEETGEVQPEMGKPEGGEDSDDASIFSDIQPQASNAPVRSKEAGSQRPSKRESRTSRFESDMISMFKRMDIPEPVIKAIMEDQGYGDPMDLCRLDRKGVDQLVEAIRRPGGMKGASKNPGVNVPLRVKDTILLICFAMKHQLRIGLSKPFLMAITPSYV